MIYLVTNQLTLYSDFTCITPQEALDYLDTLNEVGLDSETTGLDVHTEAIICLQLGCNKNQYIIDNTVDLRLYKQLLETKLLIIQNAQFDLQFLFKYGIYPTKIWDTQIAEMILTTGLDNKEDIKYLKPYGLEHLAERDVSLKGLVNKYCNVILDKAVRNFISIEGLSKRVIIYSAKDIEYLFEIKAKQIIELERLEVTDKLIWLEMEVVKVFARLLYNGFNIDQIRYRRDVIKIVLQEEAKLLQELDDTIKDLSFIQIANTTTGKSKKMGIAFMEDMFTGIKSSNINWSSPEQKLGVLKTLGVNAESTNANILSKLKSKHAIVGKLLQYNKFKKLDESFGNNFLKNINKITGRLHPSIWQVLSTGRISMSKPNLAQIPSKGELGKVIRTCFIPRNKNYSIVGGDYSGFELRIIAEFSQDPLWVTAFKEGKDLHSVLCCETFDISMDKVRTPFYANKDITYRDVQKTINFGLVYGMSEFKLSNTIQVSVSEARKIIKKFFSKVPKVKKLLDTLSVLGKKRGFIKTAPPFSRKRIFPKWLALQELEECPDEFRWLGEIERASKNSPFQGTNGDIIKLALIKVQEEIDVNNWDVNILLTVYDEIQTEAHNSIKEEWRSKLQQLMIEAAEEVIKTIPVVVDVKIDEHWCK